MNSVELLMKRPSARTGALRKPIPASTEANDIWSTGGDDVDIEWIETSPVLAARFAEFANATWVDADALTQNYLTGAKDGLVMVVAGQNETAVNSPRVKVARSALEAKRNAMAVRLRMLRSLPSDHDGQGAAAPSIESIDAALAFLGHLVTPHRFSVTVNDDGYAVVEFEDRKSGFAADITFLDGNGLVECYYRPSRFEPSDMITGMLNDSDVQAFLSQKMGVVA